MKKLKVNKTISEINEKIKSGKAVVVTAEEMIDIVARHGEAHGPRIRQGVAQAAREERGRGVLPGRASATSAGRSGE